MFEKGRDFAARGSAQGTQVSAATARQGLSVPHAHRRGEGARCDGWQEVACSRSPWSWAARKRRQPDSTGLAGTSWQLLRFRGGDDKVLTPGDGTQYTLAFGADGRVSARIDCNRGSGAWKSDGKGQIEFGPMAVTRAMCPPGSMPMHDHILKQLPHIRSYVIKDGHLFLSLMADGGTYELEPLR